MKGTTYKIPIISVYVCLRCIPSAAFLNVRDKIIISNIFFQEDSGTKLINTGVIQMHSQSLVGQITHTHKLTTNFNTDGYFIPLQCLVSKMAVIKFRMQEEMKKCKRPFLPCSGYLSTRLNTKHKNKNTKYKYFFINKLSHRPSVCPFYRLSMQATHLTS